MIRVLGALGIGALAMYFLDPASGRRRRALLRDRAQGMVAETKGAVQKTLGERGGATPVDIDLSQER